MATVYVSSTVADLKSERTAVINWLVQAGHQPVHSYVPDSETARQSCLNDVDGCELYVLILGHRYGHVPEENNPEGLSITRLEFRRAGEVRVPRVALLRTSLPDVAMSDLKHPEISQRVWAFREEVKGAIRVAEFADLTALIVGLSTGVQRELAKRKGAQSPFTGDDSVVLGIIGKLASQLVSKDAVIASKDAEIAALRASAIVRTLNAAARPDASPQAVKAAQALHEGDTGPAEALLRKAVDDEASPRPLAAELAREQGALALRHDVRGAVAAYERAAELDPQDTWTHFFLDDLRLIDATQSFDWERTRALCVDFMSHLRSAAEPYPAAYAKRVLATLRRKRQFALMQQVADVLIQSGQRSPRVQRQYAQALIEQGQLFAALQSLQALRRDLEDILSKPGPTANAEREGLEVELGETYGLIARAHKQAYVDARKPGPQVREHLVQAISQYHHWYARSNGNALWHGINTVALLCRAQRDHVKVTGYPDPQALARDIAAVIRRKKDAHAWDCATAMEAYLATGEAPEAQGWLAEYIRRLGTDADAFEYGGTLRQLEEVWQLDAASEMGARLLEPLRNALLRQAGGEVTYQSVEIGGRYEGNFGAEQFRDLDWLDTARQRCRSVARLETHAGVGVGTGFVIRGSDLHERFGGQLLLLTNSHVVADEADVNAWGGSEKPALFRDEARVTFATVGAKEAYWTVKTIHASSPPSKLDFSLLELDHPPPVQEGIPVRGRAVRGARNVRVYIIGHPYGESLKYSLYDNLVLGAASPLLHYRTPTEKGSSGSPVFDDAWELVALHHKGGDAMRRIDGQAGTYAANEGILIGAIRDALA